MLDRPLLDRTLARETTVTKLEIALTRKRRASFVSSNLAKTIFDNDYSYLWKQP
jgi:hypothetical protein